MAEFVANKCLKWADAGVERTRYFASAINDEPLLPASLMAVAQAHRLFYLRILAASDTQRFNHAFIIK